MPDTSTLEPLRLEVGLGARSYDILVGAGLLASAGARIKPFAKGRVFVVTDANVAALHLAALTASLTGANLKLGEPIVLPPGEATKTMAEMERLVSALLERGLERGDLLVALGGGVAGDMTGFAAAIALRGVDFIQIPTTLLAQVDSSVGGKTGVDTPYGKNTVGAFHQPRLVLIDTNLLQTLPPRERRAGYAELMKHGLINDEPFFAWLEANGTKVLANDPRLTPEAVHKSCGIKAAIVAADEREAGARALLNLGHTFAHALETELGYSDALLHGEAVSIGCRLAASLSARLSYCPAADAGRLTRHLKETGLPAHPRDLNLPRLDPERLLQWMSRDKKAKDGRATLVLLKGIGKAFLTREVPQDALLAFLADEFQ